MDRKCQKCGNTVSPEDFLCPHCGAILEEIPEANAVSTTKKIHNVRFLRILIPFLLLTVLIPAALFIWKQNDLSHTQPPTQVGSQPTEPVTSTPLVAYDVKVSAESLQYLIGVLIHVCKDGEVLYTCEALYDGTATFVLPRSDGYYIRLENLPQPYRMLYGDMEYSFAKGEYYLQIRLKLSKVPYTVKIVNREGEPLSDARIEFQGAEERMQISTNDQGICLIEDKYVDYISPKIRIYSYPTGYSSLNREYRFDQGSNQLTIVLDRYEELELQETDALYKLRVTDEFGDPIPELFVGVMIDSEALGDYGCTNSDGVFTFIAPKEESQMIRFSQLEDYSTYDYTFDAGVYEREIALQIHTPLDSYHYQIRIHDQYQQPISDVTVYYQWPNGVFEYFVSDENGWISMDLPEGDKSKVFVRIKDVPPGYRLVQGWLMTYFFTNASNRSIEIQLELTALPEVKIIVEDQYGDPVENATIILKKVPEQGNTKYCFTDRYGIVNVKLEPIYSYQATLLRVPEGYKADQVTHYFEPEVGTIVFVVNRISK